VAVSGKLDIREAWKGKETACLDAAVDKEIDYSSDRTVSLQA